MWFLKQTLLNFFLDYARMLEPRSSKEANFWILNSHVWRLQYHHSESVYGITQDVFFSSGIFLTTTTYYKTYYYYENSFKNEKSSISNSKLNVAHSQCNFLCHRVCTKRHCIISQEFDRHKTPQCFAKRLKFPFLEIKTNTEFSVFWHRIGLNRVGVMSVK